MLEEKEDADVKLYNSMTRKKETFTPLEPGKVRMYVCGPTVYNYFHIGNARPFMIFDALRRYMKYRGYDVKYVQNFTDVDDKIIQRAQEEGTTPEAIAEKYIEAYFHDADALGIQRADVHPRVTETMEAIVNFISVLIDKGYAYEANGDVYFDAMAYPGYGGLSGQRLEELEAGARVAVNSGKKHASDFALWKAKKAGEPAWPSPWSEGRPGWHIECSVMSTEHLGPTLDIHAGGHDLIFPHHENEIAQSEAYSGKTYVRYWLHNGYINIDNEKMSKSKNNFFTVRDILEHHDGETVRFFLLSAHYRNPVNFSEEMMASAKSALERLYNGRDHLQRMLEVTEDQVGAHGEAIDAFRDRFIAHMDDDFNTADGLSVLFELVRFANTNLGPGSARSDVKRALDLLDELADVLGILTRREAEDLDAEIERLIEERQEARASKDFKRADEIRDTLLERGIELKDTPQGVVWTRR